MVLVALDPDDPDLFWGGARIAADADNRRAEYSVTIRSDKQGLGLGRICFERVLDYASVARHRGGLGQRAGGERRHAGPGRAAGLHPPPRSRTRRTSCITEKRLVRN